MIDKCDFVHSLKLKSWHEKYILQCSDLQRSKLVCISSVRISAYDFAIWAIVHWNTWSFFPISGKQGQKVRRECAGKKIACPALNCVAVKFWPQLEPLRACNMQMGQADGETEGLTYCWTSPNTSSQVSTELQERTHIQHPHPNTRYRQRQRERKRST